MPLTPQVMRSKVAVGLLSAVPIPLSLVRPILARDNARENRKDSWQRLRVHSEAARYGAVRTVTERYARDGLSWTSAAHRESSKRV